jgi:hypothetical protein
VITTSRHTKSWFASLRRDGGLFVALATLLLVLSGFQPTSVASASGLVICTSDGAAHVPLQPLDHKDCAHCLASSACGGLSITGKLLPSGGLELASRGFSTPVTPLARSVASEPTLAGGPPGIRAPPFSA